ncbi:MAG TPA: glutamate-cysteine ligase family protein, partial [Usitatibacter sp.]|nr:glutamate-cysteine ligase family protein [Usitatibacter sp.]
FIALSASSPFSQGVDTSFETSRLHAVSAFPLSGQMPPVVTWNEFNRYFDEMAGYGIVASMKDFYWDIRPKPEYGTIEIRICDTPLTVEGAAQLAAYAQVLAAHLLEHRRHRPLEPQYRVYGYNRFQACRFGFEAQLIDPYERASVRLREHLLDTLDRVAPEAAALEAAAPLESLWRMAQEQQNDSRWLRERYAESKSMPDVVRMQAQRWSDGAQEAPAQAAGGKP